MLVFVLSSNGKLSIGSIADCLYLKPSDIVVCGMSYVEDIIAVYDKWQVDHESMRRDMFAIVLNVNESVPQQSVSAANKNQIPLVTVLRQNSDDIVYEGVI